MCMYKYIYIGLCVCVCVCVCLYVAYVYLYACECIYGLHLYFVRRFLFLYLCCTIMYDIHKNIKNKYPRML